MDTIVTTALSDLGAGWRDAALNEALRAEAYGDGMDVLLGEIRRCRPGSHTLLLWPDRLQLLRFLQAEAHPFRSLLAGSDGFIERGENCPYIGWYAAEWEGASIEIALTPSAYTSGCVIGICDEKRPLQRFAKALERFAIRPAGRCLRYANGWKSAPNLDREIGKVTWDDIILEPGALAGIREAVEGFVRHRGAFAALGFPWRRGILLIGPPGTGKTMICKAAATVLPDLPFLYVRDFQADDDHGDAITKIFERARKLAPCLLAFEDIDGLVNEQNRTQFLDELDGFQNNNGLLIIASSNHPDRIDEALLKRPSRFDRVFTIGLPALPERRSYCRRMLTGSPLSARLSPELDVEALADRVAERSKAFTPAYLKEVFIAAALRLAQDGIDVLDARFAEATLAQVEELRKHLRQLRDAATLGEMNDSCVEAIGIRRR